MSWLEALGVFRRPPDARSAAEIEAEVRAEIEHHLACKELELVREGSTPEEAHAEALQRFGNVARVQAACLRLQTGEPLMLQRIHLALSFLMLVALAFLGWNNVEARRAAAEAEKLAATRAELEKLTEQGRQLMGRLVERRRSAVEHIVIGVGDRLELLDTHGMLCVTEEVAADGKILVPEAGWVHVDGLTREAAEKAVTQALAPYYVEVDVKVKVVVPVNPLQSAEFEAF